MYKGLVAGDDCRKNQLPECEQAVQDLNQIVQDQSAAIIKAAEQREKDKKELQDLYDARERQSVQNTKQEQRTKRFALISYAGCGVDLKPSVGLGIGYIFWRF